MLAAHEPPLQDADETAELADDDDGVQSDWRPGALEPRARNFKGRSNLSAMQRDFARHFVLNGGNGAAAARAAGYASGTMAVKCLTNPLVLHEIKRISIVNAEARLPELLAKAFALVEDERLHPKDALDSIFKLLDRLGMKPKAAPLVEINNNSSHVHFGSEQAQQVIADIWAARQRRVSGISDGMTDRAPLIDATPAADVLDPHGGGDSQGPVSGPDPIPPHSPENSADVSDD